MVSGAQPTSRQLSPLPDPLHRRVDVTLGTTDQESPRRAGYRPFALLRLSWHPGFYTATAPLAMRRAPGLTPIPGGRGPEPGWCHAAGRVIPRPLGPWSRDRGRGRGHPRKNQTRLDSIRVGYRNWGPAGATEKDLRPTTRQPRNGGHKRSAETISPLAIEPGQPLCRK